MQGAEPQFVGRKSHVTKTKAEASENRCVRVKFQFRGEHFEIHLVLPPDMERRLYRRLRKHIEGK